MIRRAHYGAVDAQRENSQTEGHVIEARLQPALLGQSVLGAGLQLSQRAGSGVQFVGHLWMVLNVRVC